MRQNTLRKMSLLCTKRRAWRKIFPLGLRVTSRVTGRYQHLSLVLVYGTRTVTQDNYHNSNSFNNPSIKLPKAPRIILLTVNLSLQYSDFSQTHYFAAAVAIGYSQLHLMHHTLCECQAMTIESASHMCRYNSIERLSQCQLKLMLLHVYSL